MKSNFFAASNSTRGFVSYYHQVFGDCRRIYVIKGGPGTGKSRFMEELARGRTAKRYYCSSDPESLDGIIVGDVAVIDGTAPHVWEPKLVGAKEEILNLGDFWNSSALEKRREEIVSLSTLKAHAYEDAYAYLAAIGENEKATARVLEELIDGEKLQRAALRLLRGVKAGSGKRRIGLCRAISMKGLWRLDTYESADEVVYLQDYLGSGHLMLGAIESICTARGVDTVVSPCPLFPERLDALYLPTVGKSFVLQEEGEGLSMKRFFKSSLREARPRLRHGRAVRETLLSMAVDSLKGASEAHFALEQIYSGAMDFGKKEAYTEEIRHRLFDC